MQNYVLGVTPSPESRGGVDYFGPDGDQGESLTAALRGGETQFLLSVGGALGGGSVQTTETPGGGGGRAAIITQFTVTTITPLSVQSQITALAAAQATEVPERRCA